MNKDYTGFGSLGEALANLDKEGYQKIFVVASQKGWQRFNPGKVRPFFANRQMELFTDFSVNPDFQEILRGCEAFRAFQPDLLVAIGGGSPIDVAKMSKATVFTKESYDPEEPETMKPSGEGPPLVAVATTAGSGSEATQFAIFYVGEKKQSLGHPSVRPEIAVADPEMSYSLPPAQTAATGFDALSQAVESYWSSFSTPESRELAKVAIGYVVPNIYTATRKPDPASRYNMMQAAYLSGKAINITKTTLPHALAYHLTKRYGLPHGHAVAITVPFFFLLNVDPYLRVITPHGVEAHQTFMNELYVFLGQSYPEDAFGFWRSLMRACGLKFRLADIGLDTREKMEELTASVNPTRLKNHPVEIPMRYLVDFFLKNDAKDTGDA